MINNSKIVEEEKSQNSSDRFDPNSADFTFNVDKAPIMHYKDHKDKLKEALSGHQD